MSFFSVNVSFHILGTMMDQKNAMKLNPGGGAWGTYLTTGLYATHGECEDRH